MGLVVNAPSLASPVSSALLTVAKEAHRVRELRCWSAAQRNTVEAGLLALHTQWCGDWGLAAGPSPGTGAAPKLSDKDTQEALALQLFGPASPAAMGRSSAQGIAQSLVSEAWADWLGRLADALGQPAVASPSATAQMPAPAPSVSPQPWDGSLEVAIPWWGGYWPLRLDAAAVVHVLGREALPQPMRPQLTPAPLVPLTHALAHQPLSLTAQLAPVSLTLGQLEGLRVGDIIPLSHRLDEPATLVLHTSAATSSPWCVAWLGQRQGRMAAELSPLEP